MATSTTVSTASPNVFASTPQFTRPTFLMCPPEWYNVDYVLNPWMAGNVHRASRDLAFAQWKGMHNVLRSVADVRLLHPEPGCPDMVFLAHGALIHNGVAAISSFNPQQRRAETAYLRRWLLAQNFLLWETPRETPFEGEGEITGRSVDVAGHPGIEDIVDAVPFWRTHKEGWTGELGRGGEDV